jgi:YidC/Oxa1 family membrane protein insertase
VLLVVLLGALYFVQQRMVAARASISPTMSAGQQKLMQYLPVFFAIFQIFFLAALVVYYVFQTIFRILQQAYITRAFYGHDESLGRQAQRAGDAAREEAKKNPDGGGGFFAQAKRDLTGPTGDTKGSGSAKNSPAKKPAAKDAAAKPSASTSKRVTPPKNRPTPSSGAKGRPTPTRQEAQASKTKPKKSSKSTRPNSPKKSS